MSNNSTVRLQQAMKKTLISFLCASVLWGIAAPNILPGGSPPVSLAEHMAAQLSCRTNGGDYNFITKTNQIYYLLPAQPRLTANFWLRDVTNILASSVGRFTPDDALAEFSPWFVGACLSPISPRHCLGSTHATGNLQDPHLWLLPDGSFYTNSILAVTNLGGDITICLMTKTNPASYRVLPDISSKVSGVRNGDYTKSKPALAVLMHYSSQNTPCVTTFTAALLYTGAQCGHATNQLEFGNYSLGYKQISGDSSSPILTVINNEAVLVCQVYSSLYGTALWRETNAINSAMANLSTNNSAPVYQMSLYDLSGFPDQ